MLKTYYELHLVGLPMFIGHICGPSTYDHVIDGEKCIQPLLYRTTIFPLEESGKTEYVFQTTNSSFVHHWELGCLNFSYSG